MNRRYFLPLAATAVAGTAALGYYAWDQATLTADRRREDEPTQPLPLSVLPADAANGYCRRYCATRLEETPGPAGPARRLGLSGSGQFVLRLGYPEQYPEPVSVRRPVEWFVRV